MRIAFTSVLSALALVLIGSFAHAETNSAGLKNNIVIKNYAFEPASITIKTGNTITWINRDDDPHTVKSVPTDEMLKSPALDTNDKFSFTFSKPGVYKYFCTLHPHMQGEIIVR